MPADPQTECSLTSPARMVIRIAACGYFLAAAVGLVTLSTGPVASVMMGLLALPLLSVRWHQFASLTLMAVIILTAANVPVGFGPLGGLEHVAAALAILFIVIASHLTLPGKMHAARAVPQ